LLACYPSLTMARDRTPPRDDLSAPKPVPEQSPLSLNRLRAAFAQMLGSKEQGAGSTEPGTENNGNDFPAPDAKPPSPAPDPCEISPRTVVEAMLFVSRPDDTPFTARELAAAMRGVSPGEITAAVAELNAAYERDAAPYEIVSSAAGYRLQLRDELRRMRDKLHGRVRQTRLSPAAVEVLSIVAYNQPTTAAAISELRGAPSGAVLQSLVSRKLVCVQRSDDRSSPPHFSTTERFLRVFGLEGVEDLPRNEELEKL
jgi:segregation and condensation protein B